MQVIKFTQYCSAGQMLHHLRERHQCKACSIRVSTMMPASPPLPASQAGGAPDGDLCSGCATRLSFTLDARGLGNRASRTGLHHQRMRLWD